mgnify:CR=1 FL=1
MVAEAAPLWGDLAIGLVGEGNNLVFDDGGISFGHSVSSVHWAIWVISYGWGFWAACGCSGPAYTLSFLII